MMIDLLWLWLPKFMYAAMISLALYIIIGTAWLAVTQPTGRAGTPVDGHCYRYESRSFGPIPNMGNVYWEINCP